MAAQWSGDDALVTGVAEHLFNAMSMFPKRLVRVDELIHAFGMPVSQIQVLTLVEREDLSIRELSERTGVAKPNITPLVDALTERGLVSRRQQESDRRVVRVHIEPAGEELLRQMREAVAGQVRAWPKSITRPKAKKLLTGLEAIEDALEAMQLGEE